MTPGYGVAKRGPRGNVVRAHPWPWRGREYFHAKYENGGWGWHHWQDGRRIDSLGTVELPLWRHEQLAAATSSTPVMLCEGEKDVETAEGLGFLATSAPHGALAGKKKWSPLYTKQLARFDCVIVIEDNDAPGRQHSEKCARALRDLIADLRVVHLPDLPDHGDLTDWITAGHTADDLRQRIAETPQWRELNGAVITRVSDVEKKPVLWLWQARIPLGMVTLLDGDPGTGKSTMLLDLTARVTRGLAMPDGTGGGEPGTVVLLSAEDDPNAVIRPRLEAAGADLERVILISIRDRETIREPIISDEDIARIEESIASHSAALLVVDPIVAYLPDETDTNSDHNVRRVLGRLKGLAERAGCAVVCVRHFRKGSSDNALYRGGGSIGFIGAARSGLVVATDPDDREKRRRVLAVSKANLAPIAPSWEFRLEAASDSDFPRVMWLGVSNHSAGALTAEQKGENKLDEAAGFLEERLASGPVPSQAILDEAKETGISSVTLRRAKKKLEVRSRKDETGALWLWELPKGDAYEAESTEVAS